MRASAGQFKNKLIVVHRINQQPVWLNMAPMVLSPIARKLMVFVFGRKRLLFQQFFKDFNEELFILSSLQRKLVIFLELA